MDCSLISNISDIAEIVGVGLAIYGARRAYKQWQHDKKVERNNQMRSFIRGLLDDERIYKVVLDIDHNRLEGVQNTENEKPVDALLFNLNHVCHSYRMGLVGEDEMSLIDYLLDSIAKDHEIQKYIDSIGQYSIERGVESPFSELVKYNRDKWGKASNVK